MDNKDPVIGPELQMTAIQDAIYLIGGKWRIPIINAICNGNNRFTAILNAVPGITRRSLAKELRDMEMNFLITRTISSSSPLIIDYHTTEYSETFSPIIIELIRFGIEHKRKVLSFNKPIKNRQLSG